MEAGFTEGITCHNASDSSVGILLRVKTQPGFSLPISTTLSAVSSDSGESWGWLCHRGTLFLRRVSCPGLPFSPVLVPVVELCSTHAAISAAGPGSGQQRRNTLKKTLNPHQCGASPSSLSKDDSLF